MNSATTLPKPEIEPTPPRSETAGAAVLSQARFLSLELGDDFLVWSARGGELTKSKLRGCGVILDSQLRDPAVAQRYLTDLAIITRDQCRVFLQLSVSEAVLRSFFVPAVPSNELGQVVHWEATKIFPFLPDPNWFAWRVINTLEWGGVRKHQIQAVAIPPQRIEPICNVLTERFVLDGISLTPLIWEPFLLAQMKQSNLPRDKAVAVVRYFGQRLTVLCFNNGSLEFTRESHLDAAVTGDDFDASLNFLQQAESYDRDPHSYVSVNVEALAGLVAEELDYYYGRFSQRIIERIYLSVPPQICASVQEALVAALGVGVDPICEPGPSDESAPQLFAPAERVYCRKHTGLDLTPAAYRRGRRERKILSVAAACTALILLVVVAAVIAQRTRLSTLTESAAGMEQNLQAVRGSSAYQDLQYMVVQSEHWLSQYSALNRDDWSVARLLKVLSQLTPAAVYLSDLQVQAITGEDGARRAAVSLTGFVSDATAYPEIQLARYIKSLSARPHLTQVLLRNQYVGISDAGRRLHFTVSMEVAE